MIIMNYQLKLYLFVVDVDNEYSDSDSVYLFYEFVYFPD